MFKQKHITHNFFNSFCLQEERLVFISFNSGPRANDPAPLTPKQQEIYDQQLTDHQKQRSEKNEKDVKQETPKSVLQKYSNDMADLAKEHMARIVKNVCGNSPDGEKFLALVNSEIGKLKNGLQGDINKVAFNANFAGKNMWSQEAKSGMFEELEQKLNMQLISKFIMMNEKGFDNILDTGWKDFTGDYNLNDPIDRRTAVLDIMFGNRKVQNKIENEKGPKSGLTGLKSITDDAKNGWDFIQSGKPLGTTQKDIDKAMGKV